MDPFGRKKTVLIIDDDKNRRKKIYDVLKLTGFDLFSANTGAEAMPRLPSQKPRMVIVSTVSKAFSGIEFVKELRTYGLGQKMTVVGIVSAADGERKPCIAAGANDILQEGFEPYRLVEMVSKYMNIDKLEIPEEQFAKRREVVEELADSYRERVRESAKGEPSPAVQLLLPDGRDLGMFQLTEDAGKHRA